MYSEIQSVYLPLMLKRIIKTLNTHCSKMSNLDLSKSVLLCSKILKKVVPEIVIADQHKPPSSMTASSGSSNTKSYQTSTKANPPPLKQPHTTASINEESSLISVDSTNKLVRQQQQQQSPIDDESLVINELLNDLIRQIEAQCDETPLVKQPQQQSNNHSSSLQNETSNSKSNKTENNYFIIESCVFYLKQLCHTFIRSHLIQLGSGGGGGGDQTVSHDKLKKSFQSLFNQKNSNSSSSSSQSMKSNGDNYLEMGCPNCNSSNTSSKSEETATPPREDDHGIQMIQLKPECLNYLQSFQIINKFLIKMLFFPRENQQDNDSLNNKSNNKNLKSDETTTANANEQDDQNECCKQARKQKINKLLVDSFDEWVKDLFVISCCSTFTNNNSLKQQQQPFSSKLFEFQSITINTIIELINLSESVNAHYPSSMTSSRHNSISFDSNSQSFFLNSLNANKSWLMRDKNTCLVQTVFTNKQIDLIYNQSEFGNIVAKMLWLHLSSSDAHQSNMMANTHPASQLYSTNLMTNSSSAFSHHQLLVSFFF